MKKEYIEPSVKAVEIKLTQILAGSEVIPVNETPESPEESDGFDVEFE
jgi:hypothetical protein